MPVAFDATLAAHHRLVGGWAAGRGTASATFTRPEARRHIERTFDGAVLEILKPFELAKLRVAVLCGDDGLPPAIAIVCDTVGQIELGWIEESNILAKTLGKGRNGTPPSWCAAAYRALCSTLPAALPIFGYEDLFEEMSAYYWDGETDDLGAIKVMVECHGQELDDIEQDMLPSAMEARRPSWMLAETAAALRHLPKPLQHAIRKLHDRHKALKAIPRETSAWYFDFDLITAYCPEYEDASHLPTMTLVPADQFGRELDYVGEHGMQQGFMDIAGLQQLTGPGTVDDWFASLKVGADFLLAAQELIALDPANPKAK